ncbi:MAG: T9SS type A sorting domain-containing protein [Bacteroidia bacterium]
MRSVGILSFLGAFLWAQALQVERITTRLPVRTVRLPRPLPQARQQNLPWLLPNQDFTIVPDAADEPYKGDTLISNGTGPNTRNNPPQACIGTFFDSLEAALAYIVLANERIRLEDNRGAICIQNTDSCLHLDGGIAERYDFTPDAGNFNRTVTIKGVAVALVNFAQNRNQACQISLAPPGGANDPDGAYTFTYSLYPSQQVRWGNNPGRPGTAPEAVAVRSATKRASELRVIPPGNQSGPQCVNPQESVVEMFDFVYFQRPLDITDSASYYVAVETEAYNLRNYVLTDTLYFMWGPAYNGNPNNHPCFNGDTALLGRSLVSMAYYDTTTGEFALRRPEQSWIPIFFFGLPIFRNGLNWVVFPIVYAQDIGGGVWIEGAYQRFLTPYPNPTTDCFYLRLNSQEATTLNTMLYTLDGREVKRWAPRPVPSGESTIALDVGDLPMGHYLLRVQSSLGAAAFHVTILR